MEADGARPECFVSRLRSSGEEMAARRCPGARLPKRRADRRRVPRMQQGSQSFSDYEPVAPAPRRRTPPREEDEWPAPDAGGAVATPDAESLEGSRSKKSVAKKSSAKTLAAKDRAFEPL